MEFENKVEKHIYKAHLKQKYGCGNSIGCGQILIDIEASSLLEAELNLVSIIKEEYSDEYPETKLESATLYEINSVIDMDIPGIYAEKNRIESKNLEDEKELSERAEYERLKAKFSDSVSFESNNDPIKNSFGLRVGYTYH